MRAKAVSTKKNKSSGSHTVAISEAARDLLKQEVERRNHREPFTGRWSLSTVMNDLITRNFNGNGNGQQ